MSHKQLSIEDLTRLRGGLTRALIGSGIFSLLFGLLSLTGYVPVRGGGSSVMVGKITVGVGIFVFVFLIPLRKVIEYFVLSYLQKNGVTKFDP